MRINLTKKEIINSLYMQIGFSKKTSENLLEDIIDMITKNLKKHKIIRMSSNKFSEIFLEKPTRMYKEFIISFLVKLILIN